MSIDNREFIFIDKYFEFGKILFHYGVRKRDNSPLMPVLKSNWVKEFEIDKYTLTPGYLDIDSKFYECPFLYFYFQLFKVEQIEDYSGKFPHRTNLNLQFILFNKDFLKCRKFIIELSDSQPLDFMLISNIANRLNDYVQLGYDVEEIDLTNRKQQDFNFKDKDIIIQLINNLTIEIFANSRASHKPGGDDQFWDEAEISDLPIDNYIRKLILQGLKKRWRESREINGIFIIEFNHESWYSPAYKRFKQEGDNSEAINMIKDYLKIDLSDSYDKSEHFYYFITSK